MHMTAAEAMRALEAMGTAQNRKIYARHGVPEKQFGVSFANLGKPAKQIKTDHVLAGQLWATGNADARLLATMIADPALTAEKQLRTWIKDSTYYVLADAVSKFASRTKHARACMDRWIASKEEFTAAAGWTLVAIFSGDPSIPDAYFAERVSKAERNIPTAKNRTKHAMNMALIGIGLRNAKLKKQVLAAAKRIGPVEVDHGETGCKTPEIASYIAKTEAYRARKKSV